MIKEMLIAGCGGFVGTCCRYLVGKWCARWWQGDFPVGTFLVNIAGCFLIGLFIGLVERLHLMHTLLLTTGFCGGFTTFSLFAAEIYGLWGKQEWATVLLYTLASVIIGVVLVWCGRALMR